MITRGAQPLLPEWPSRQSFAVYVLRDRGIARLLIAHDASRTPWSAAPDVFEVTQEIHKLRGQTEAL